jgi:hypothetical protein
MNALATPGPEEGNGCLIFACGPEGRGAERRLSREGRDAAWPRRQGATSRREGWREEGRGAWGGRNWRRASVAMVFLARMMSVGLVCGRRCLAGAARASLAQVQHSSSASRVLGGGRDPTIHTSRPLRNAVSQHLSPKGTSWHLAARIHPPEHRLAAPHAHGGGGGPCVLTRPAACPPQARHVVRRTWLAASPAAQSIPADADATAVATTVPALLPM